MSTLDAYLSDMAALLPRMQRHPIERFIALLRQVRAEGRCIFVFGNGGSAANASHFAVDMMKGTVRPDQRRLRIVCLNDGMPTLTALANDMGYEHVFSEPLVSLAEPGDVALAISGSGNFPNVLRAVEAARRLGLTTVGMTGLPGGELKDMVDLAIVVPSTSMQMIEDTHLIILHAIFLELREA